MTNVSITSKRMMRLGVLSVSVALRRVRLLESGAGRRAAAMARAMVVQSVRLAMVRSMRMLQRVRRARVDGVCCCSQGEHLSSPCLTRAQPSRPCGKVSWERSWGSLTSLSRQRLRVARVLTCERAACLQPERGAGVPDWGSLHPSTRRDASPALGWRTESSRPGSATRTFRCFHRVGLSSAAGIRVCSDVQAHAEEDPHRPRPLGTRRGCLAIAKGCPRHRAASPGSNNARRQPDLRLRRPRPRGIR